MLASAASAAHVLYPAWVPTAMGLGDGSSALPPKAVRRTDAQVANVLLERMGGTRIDINASRLPLLAVIAGIHRISCQLHDRNHFRANETVL